MSKMGLKNTETKRYKLKPVSPDHVADLRKYHAVRQKLFDKACGLSEISGEYCRDLQPHHILGRHGALLWNPFAILLCNDKQHKVCQSEMSWENKLALLAYVIPLRIKQGYRLSDYEPLPFGCYSILVNKN